MIAINYVSFLTFNYRTFFSLFFLYVKMSAKGNQTQALNKKQRRKNARAGVQTTASLADEQSETNQTETMISTESNHQEVHDVSAAINGIQALGLSTPKQVENVWKF